MNAGDLARAEPWFRRSLETRPEDNSWASTNLVLTYLWQQQYDRAEDLLATLHDSVSVVPLMVQARIALVGSIRWRRTSPRARGGGSELVHRELPPRRHHAGESPG